MNKCDCNTYHCNDGPRISGEGDSDKNDSNSDTNDSNSDNKNDSSPTIRVTYLWSLILLLFASKFDVYFKTN